MKTDDPWMHPPTEGMSFYNHKHPDGRFYLIERKRRIPVFGNPGFIEQWDLWREFVDKAERDRELENLRETTSWHVRGRQIVYVNGEPVGPPDPFEYEDF